MLNITTREATINDLDILLKIEMTCFVSPWNEEQLLYELNENPVSNFFIAEVNGQVVGFYDYWVTFDSATISQIAVLPEYRRKGIGSFLLQEIIDDCSAKRVMNITLEVRKDNINAQKLYKKLGFKEILIKTAYYSNGDDAIYMMRKGEFH